MSKEVIETHRMSVGEFFLDVVLAQDLYLRLSSQLTFDEWVSKSYAQYKEKGFFAVYSDKSNQQYYVVTCNVAISILSDDKSSTAIKAQKKLEDLSAHTLNFHDTMLTDHDRYDVVKTFAEKAGCEDRPIPIPVDTALALVETVQLFKLQVEQMQQKLSRVDTFLVKKYIK